MGGGASKAPTSSLAIKESRAKAQALDAELKRVEEEKAQLEEKLAARSGDIEKLGHLNIELTKQVERLNKNLEKTKEESKHADAGLSAIRREQEQIKQQAQRFESELREVKGELIVEKEDHEGARSEVGRVGQLLTEVMQSKDEMEARIKAIEEERDRAEQLLRAATESMDMYKDLSSKLMTKGREQAAPRAAPGGPQAPAASETAAGVQPGGARKAAAGARSTAHLLGAVAPKVPGRLKVVVVSTFEDFFVEREQLALTSLAPLEELCEVRGVVLEMVSPWDGLLREQHSALSVPYLLNATLREVEDADVTLVLLGERYGEELGEEDGAAEAGGAHPWMAAHRSKQGRYGSILELAAVLAAFHSGPEPGALPSAGAPAGRTVVYCRDPAFVDGLPEAVTRHFKQEGARSAAKLQELRARLKEAGLVREAGYAEPAVLAQLVREDLGEVLDATFPQRIAPLEGQMLAHAQFSAAHRWTGQGGKGLALPEQVEGYLERLRKYVLSDVQQALAVVGDFGAGKTSLLHAAVMQLRKRYPPPDTLIIEHCADASPDAQDPVRWIHKVCSVLQAELGLQLPLAVRPAELLLDFPLWLEAASHTGVKLVLVLDGVDRCAIGSHADDPIAFLPSHLPQGVRCIVSTGPGKALTSLGQRGCGAVTIRPLDEKQKQVLLDGYLARTKKSLDKKGAAKLLKAERTGNPQFLLDTLEEIREIGVLDGTATLEPLLYYLEADNLQTMTEKCVYRWESAYNGKIIAGSLVRDALTCMWAARFGVRRAELVKMLRLSAAQMSPLLTRLQNFLRQNAGLLGFQSCALREAVRKRYLPSPDAEQEAHKYLARFFEDAGNAAPSRRIRELPWQLARTGDVDALSRCIVGAEMFLQLFRDEHRADLWSYVAILEQNEAHLNLGGYCKASVTAYENANPHPEAWEVAELLRKFGSMMAELGFLDVAGQLLVKAMGLWSEAVDEDDERVAVCAGLLAKVLANMRSPEEAEKLFVRAVGIRTRLGKRGAPPEDFAVLLNEYGLHQKRQGSLHEAARTFGRASEIWTRHHGTEHLTVATANLNLSTVYYAMNSLPQAHEHAAAALAARQAAVGGGHPLYAEALVNLAAVELARHDNGRARREAERMLGEGIAILQRTLGGQHPDTLWARSFVGLDGDLDLDDESESDEGDEGHELQAGGANAGK